VTLRLTESEFAWLQERRAARTPSKSNGSRWEIEFAFQLARAGIAFEREYRFIADRRFRADFAFPAQRVAIEIDGAVHRIKKRFHSDREKGNLATLHGWRVLHVTRHDVLDGTALALALELLQRSTS
jgi:very-short-patch-repair endonuclease